MDSTAMPGRVPTPVPTRVPIRVLVAVATRHGGTVGVAAAVADGLLRGLGGAGTVTVRRARDVRDVRPYSAVVVGSAVYRGHWLEEADDLVRRCAFDLEDRPVWLFSNGPAPADVGEVATLSRARGSEVFGGRLRHGGLRVPERVLVPLERAPGSDVRDAAAAAGWGARIGRELAGVPTADPDPLTPAH